VDEDADVMAKTLDTDASPFGTYPDGVLFYGVVSARTEKVVEFFLAREAG
jgi:hypothetical protein